MKEYTIQSSKNKDTGFLDITLQGHLNIAYISKLQKELESKIKNSKKINLEISEVDEADLSMIQFLVAFRQHCQNSNVDLKINFNFNNETLELLTRAGLANTIN